MIELGDKNVRTSLRQSSKGNQLKWEHEGIWYKADYTGYEGLADRHYLSRLLTIDALFLNEDRHMHNVAVLRDKTGAYHFSPVFDNGCALLSDTTMDYPLSDDIIDLIPEVHAKTLCRDFNEQLDAVEKLYGQTMKFARTLFIK